MWEEEAAVLLGNQGSLTKLAGMGTTLDRIIRQWIQTPPDAGGPPEIRRGFFSLPEARAILTKHSPLHVKGDLQMHTQWSDGSGSIEDMARAADERGYEYIAITDHSKGLKIAGGITETELEQQGAEIGNVNEKLQAEGVKVTVLRQRS
jgi:PHP domain